MLQRVLIRSLARGLAPTILVCAPALLLAQQPRPAGNTTIPPRTANVPAQGVAAPQGQPQSAVQGEIPVINRGLKERVIDPQMQQILEIWERHTGKFTRMEGEFIRYEYDDVFLVEKQTSGNYYYEAPDHGRIDFKPMSAQTTPDGANGFRVVEGKVLHRKDGKDYSVVPGAEERWICNGQELLSIDVSTKTYRRIGIPEQYRGDAIRNGPLPFMFGMKAQDVIDKYDLDFGPMHDPRGEKTPNRVIHIIAYPLMETQRREFQKAEVLISSQTFEAIAIKLFDPSGNKETVYKFTKHGAPKLPWLNNKFSENMFGYKCILDETAPPKRETNRVDPNGTVIR